MHENCSNPLELTHPERGADPGQNKKEVPIRSSPSYRNNSSNDFSQLIQNSYALVSHFPTYPVDFSQRDCSMFFDLCWSVTASLQSPRVEPHFHPFFLFSSPCFKYSYIFLSRLRSELECWGALVKWVRIPKITNVFTSITSLSGVSFNWLKAPFI